MCPILPPAMAIKKFDCENGGLIVGSSIEACLIYIFWHLDHLISVVNECINKRTWSAIPNLPFMHSVWDQNVGKIAVAGGSTGHCRWLHGVRTMGRTGGQLELFSMGKCTEAARLQRIKASVFLMVAVCLTTHSVLQDIVLLAGVQVHRSSNSTI